MKALDVVRRVVEAGAALRKRRADGQGLVSLDSALEVVEATTVVARRARAGPLPPARGLERIALGAARTQLAMMADLMGLPRGMPADPPPAEPSAGVSAGAASDDDSGSAAVEGFVSPSDRALMREEREAVVRAALGALVAETIALADAVLASAPELEDRRGGRRGLPVGTPPKR